MDTLRVAWDVVRDTAVTIWNQYPAVVLGVVGAIVVVALLSWLVVAVVRRRRASHVPSRAERLTTPVYRDRTVIDDLQVLGTDAEEADAHVDLEQALAGLEAKGALVDLDADPAADLDTGQVVVASGTLHTLPGTRAAELLELSAPLLARADGADGADGDTATAIRTRPNLDNAPVVAALDHASSKRRLLMLLRRQQLEDGVADGGTVTAVAVVDRVLEKRDSVGPDDYLRAFLSDDGTRLLDGRSLDEVIGSIGDVAGEDLPQRELAFRGPGAQVRAASLHR